MCAGCGGELAEGAIKCECGAFAEGAGPRGFWPVDPGSFGEEPLYRYASLPRSRLSLAAALALIALLSALAWVAFTTPGAGNLPKLALPALGALAVYYAAGLVAELRSPRTLLAYPGGLVVPRKDGPIFLPWESLRGARALPYGFLGLDCSFGPLRVDLFQRKQLVLRAIAAEILEAKAKAAASAP